MNKVGEILSITDLKKKKKMKNKVDGKKFQLFNISESFRVVLVLSRIREEIRTTIDKRSVRKLFLLFSYTFQLKKVHNFSIKNFFNYFHLVRQVMGSGALNTSKKYYFSLIHN